MEKIPSTGPEVAPAKPTIHRSRFVTSAMVGLASMASVAKAQEVDLPSTPTKNVLQVEAPAGPSTTQQKTTAPRFQVGKRSETIVGYSKEVMLKVMHKDLNKFLEMAKVNANAEDMELVWCEFAQTHPLKFLEGVASYKISNNLKLMYITAATNRMDSRSLSHWLYHDGGMNDLLDIMTAEDTKQDFYFDLAMKRKLPAYPSPEEVEAQIKTETMKERSSRLIKLMNTNLDDFMEEFKLRAGEPLGDVWDALYKAHSKRLLEEIGSFSMPATRKFWMALTATGNLDPITIANWVSNSKELLKEIEAGVQKEGHANESFKDSFKQLKNFPSPETATLMTAFFLKNSGRAIDWHDVLNDKPIFGIARALLERHPEIAEWVNQNTKAGDTTELDKALELLRVRDDHYEEHKTFTTPDFSDAVTAWAKKYGVANPHLLAREAVLIAQDIMTRGVSGDSAEDIKKSIERLERGRNELAKHDWLAGDVGVLISGEVVKGKQPGQLRYDLEKKAYTKMQIAHHRKHRDGDAKFEYLRTPTNPDGSVTEEHVIKAHAENMKYLSSPSKQRTVIIAMHGADMAIALFNKYVRSDRLLDRMSQATGPEFDYNSMDLQAPKRVMTVEDFVQAYKKRLSYERVADQFKAGKRDIFFFDQCQSFDFAKNFYAALQKEGLPLPIIVAAAERNSNSLYRPGGSEGQSEANFSNLIAKQGIPHGLHGIAKNAHIIDSPDATPMVIFIPDPEDESRPMQVTDAQPQNGGATTSTA